jgi:Flp pilus assembly protein TadG
MAKNRFRNQQGSAIVELALTAPLLLGMLICTAEVARIAYAAIEVQNAARAGAAYAAQNGGTLANTTNIDDAAQNEAPNLTLTTTPSEVCVCETTTYNSSGVPDPGYVTYSCTSTSFTECNTVSSTETQQAITYVQVLTSATVQTMFAYNYHGFGLPSSFALSGRSQMRMIASN